MIASSVFSSILTLGVTALLEQLRREQPSPGSGFAHEERLPATRSRAIPARWRADGRCVQNDQWIGQQRLRDHVVPRERGGEDVQIVSLFASRSSSVLRL